MKLQSERDLQIWTDKDLALGVSIGIAIGFCIGWVVGYETAFKPVIQCFRPLIG